MPNADILIVGGGAAGLTTAGALKHAGFDSVILDRDDRIGGTWSRRYERLHLHTERRFSALAHYPIPPEYGRFPPKDKFAEYLADYAKHFALNWQGKTPVRKIRVENGSRAPRFEVETERETWTSRVVVVSTGHFGTPVMARFPGDDKFQGTLMHSYKYTTGREFAGKRVLVIGAGNSGAEIAADLAEQGAAQVVLCIRTMPPVVPREWLGMSAQMFGISLSPLPPRIADKIGESILRLAVGDLSRYGMTHPAWWPFSAQRVPVIDVGLVKELKAGRVVVRPNLARLTEHGATFVDGRSEDVDVVIVATGFRTGLADLLAIPNLLNDLDEPKFPSGQTTAQPGLYFLGYVYSPRGHLFEASIASRKLARAVARYMR